MSTDAFRHRDLMVSGTIDRAIVHLGAPAAFAALLQAGFLIVDTFWLGRIGPVALAAASTAGFLMWMAQALGEGTAAGSGAVLARAIGAADLAGTRRAATAGLVLALAGGVGVSLVGLALAPACFAFMGTADDVTRQGLAYIRVILAAMPAYFLFVWIAAALRATGDARTPVRLLALAAGSNFLACPALVFGLGPLPGLAIQGAGFATAGSWLAAAIIGSILLARRGLLARLIPSPAAPAVCRHETVSRRKLISFTPEVLPSRLVKYFGDDALRVLGRGGDQ